MRVPSELETGYRRFLEDRFAIERRRYQDLAREQRPSTMIIGCADSRVDPATIFSAAPGELFIVRNVAALAPPFEAGGGYHGTSAAVEFAVEGLQVERIVVLGHGLCGGIAAALASADQEPVGQFVKPWVELISEDRDAVIQRLADASPAERQKALERQAIRRSLDNLRSFGFVADAVRAGRLTLHGAWFSIADAELCWLAPGAEEFETVTPGAL